MMNPRELADDMVTLFYNPWFPIKIGRSAWRLEKSKYHPIFKKEDPGPPSDKQARQTQHDPLEGDEVANPGNHF